MPEKIQRSLIIKRRQVREEEQALDPSELNLALGDRQGEPIGGGRAGSGGPELVDVLGDYAKDVTVGVQRVDRDVHLGEVRVRDPGVPEQNVGVQEDQSWVSSRSR